MTYATRIAGSLLCSFLFLLPVGAEEARPFLHPLFTDHMVLQRGVKAPIWGWTTPGARVTVEAAGQKAEAAADAQGRWMVRIGPLAAGGPFSLTVRGPQTVTVNDVLVGDVWICSGQSNMEWPVNAANNAKDEIAQADHPAIRLFTVPKAVAFEPRSLVASKWEVCSPSSVGGFSAVGYFFGRHLNAELKVPIGLINSSWGGTIAEAWTSAEALRTLDDFRPRVDEVARMSEMVKRGETDQAADRWYGEKDPGTAGGWFQPDADEGAWRTAEMPKNWEAAGLADFDGIAWFRRAFDAPAEWAGRDLVLNLGPIDDYDTTWFNGRKVGTTDGWMKPRSYRIPGEAVKAGRNVIAVRVLDTGGGGGIYGQPAGLKVFPVDNEGAAVPLAGAWRMRESAPLAGIQPVPVMAADNPNVSTVLYNGMIAPLVPFAIKGAIWYQGESNAGRAWQYRTLLPTMIRDWRGRFGVGDFGFHIVSLANFLAPSDVPVENDWAELREAQALTARTLPNCGIAMTIDIGEAGDIHPRNKQEVGRRLGLSARAITYGEKGLEWSGPWFRDVKAEGGSLRIRFDHVGGGLVCRGERLAGFAVAGEDRKFQWAEGVIDGECVVVSSPHVPKPVAVRYAWHVNPVCTLFNKAGLPAVPFRSDDWPAITRDNR